MHGAPPRSPVIRLNEYNKLTENDDLLIHRYEQQRCGVFDNSQESDCTCFINFTTADMHCSCHGVDKNFEQTSLLPPKSKDAG